MEAYIVKHKNIKTRMASRSGGAFTAVSDVVLNNGGVVYGCGLSSSHQAEHRRAATKAERNSFRGSKYVQSSMGNCFQSAAADIKAGKEVMFSGTGCQIDALKHFLAANPENLLTMDIVCHGVPSPLVWEGFLQWMQEKHHGKVQKVNFRDKQYGWMVHLESTVINNHKYVTGHYRSLFQKNYPVRPCCFKCPYANLNRKSDITIADAWGVDSKYSFFNDDKGVSLVIVNTERGKNYFEKARVDLQVVEVGIEGFMQPNLRQPSTLPADRDQFWRDYRANGFDYISRKYGDNTLKGNAKSLSKRFLGKTGLTKTIKKILKK